MQDDARELVAANVRAEIARKGKTGTDAANALSVSKQVMSRMLTGQRAFRAEEIAAMARWLEVPVGVLIGERTEAAA